MLRDNRPELRSRIGRRHFLQASLASALGWAFSPQGQALLAADGPAKRAKACVLLYMNGGPSHLDTWDPKPGQPTGGPLEAIDTRVAGLKINQHLPRLAGLANHLAVIRSVTSKEDDHDRARYFVHTGNNLTQAASFPDLGGVTAHEWPAPENDLPSFVSIGSGHTGPGFFGLSCAPYVLADPSTPLENIGLPPNVKEDRLARRVQALEALNADFARLRPGEPAREPARFTRRALKFMASDAVKAFDLNGEKPETLASYGVTAENAANVFGRGCLLARRLIENGVRFVEVMLDGWDTHADNFNQVTALNQMLDAGMAALLGELKERGLLDSTLVICLGEFGRTPVINPQNGRDHWPQAFSAVLAGGGVKAGLVHGATDEQGAEIKDKPVPVPDLFATLLRLCGIDPGKTYTSPEGRPVRLGAKGKIVTELF
jgi:hypothetical protein